eukprot:TRINITY_DN4858_c0_g1_i1.p1 TRINITY_DN4858_c0_g1~~TRINITY_DN4858_c0_g1_i1.p1  ORF type:complete len:267 (+),score=39.09 TRINITY_DN4858_c0_g1_i1:29-829(+)
MTCIHTTSLIFLLFLITLTIGQTSTYYYENCRRDSECSIYENLYTYSCCTSGSFDGYCIRDTFFSSYCASHTESNYYAGCDFTSECDTGYTCCSYDGYCYDTYDDYTCGEPFDFVFFIPFLGPAFIVIVVIIIVCCVACDSSNTAGKPKAGFVVKATPVQGSVTTTTTTQHNTVSQQYHNTAAPAQQYQNQTYYAEPGYEQPAMYYEPQTGGNYQNQNQNYDTQQQQYYVDTQPPAYGGGYEQTYSTNYEQGGGYNTNYDHGNYDE